MKKIRYSLATIILVVAMSASILQGVGAKAVTNAAIGSRANSVGVSFVANKSMGALALMKPYWPCPAPGYDC